MTDLTDKGAGPRRPAGALAERLAEAADRVSLALLERLADRAAQATRAAAASPAGDDDAAPAPADRRPRPAATGGPELVRRIAGLPRAEAAPGARAAVVPAPARRPETRRQWPTAAAPGAASGAAMGAALGRGLGAATRRAATLAQRPPAAALAAAGSVLSGGTAALAARRPPRIALPRIVLPRIVLPRLAFPRGPLHAAAPRPPRRAAPAEAPHRPEPFGTPRPAAPAASALTASALAAQSGAPAFRGSPRPDPLTLSGQMEGRSRGPSAIVWLVFATLALFTTWAAFAPVSEIVRAQGEVVSSSRPQIIQNLEGGILAEMMVAEGDVIERGTPLARLEGTEFRTTVDELEERLGTLEIRRHRLEAEMAGQFDMGLPAELATRMPAIAASERALLAARQSEYVARVDGARAVLSQAQEERAILERLWEERVVALIEVTRARKAHSEAEAHLDGIVTEAELDRAAAHSETLEELASLGQQLRLSRDRLRRTVLTSPLRGTVNRLTITTIGGVVRPGEEIMQIVPLGEELFIEAQVRPRDIRHVRAGLPATIKLTAWDYTIYGSLSGEVRFVSADTFRDERRPETEPHYRVTVAVDRSALTARQQQIAVRPGMQAEVELETGSKTVLGYLTRPLHKVREAMREP